MQFYVMRANILVPEGTRLAVIVVARVPLGHNVTEIAPEYAFHFALLLRMATLFVQDVWETCCRCLR